MKLLVYSTHCRWCLLSASKQAFPARRPLFSINVGNTLDATARKMANEFFGTFAEIVGGPAAVEAPPPEARPRGLRPVIWIPALIVIVILALLYYAAAG